MQVTLVPAGGVSDVKVWVSQPVVLNSLPRPVQSQLSRTAPECHVVQVDGTFERLLHDAVTVLGRVVRRAAAPPVSTLKA